MLKKHGHGNFPDKRLSAAKSLHFLNPRTIGNRGFSTCIDPEYFEHGRNSGRFAYEQARGAIQ